jgi:PAS domain S-box-containing protein
LHHLRVVKKRPSGKSHARAEGETQITISLPKWLKDELSELAAADDRSRSKWIVRELAQLIQEKRGAGVRVLPRVAEDEPGYASLSVVETDLAGRVTSINAAFTRMCGYSEKDLLGQKPGDVLQGKATEPDVVRAFRAAIKEIRPYECTMTNYDSRGRVYRVHIKMHPLFGAAGNHVGFRAVERKLSS